VTAGRENTSFESRPNLSLDGLLTVIDKGLLRKLRMALYYVPAIAPIAYPLFFSLCDGRLPETFVEWRVIEDLSRREWVADGHHVVAVCVEPEDLRDYCRSMNCQADGVALHALAMRVGTDFYARAEAYERDRARTVIVEDARARPVADDINDRPVLVTEPAPRRHWWQFGRRPVVIEETAGGPVLVDTAPPRRHW